MVMKILLAMVCLLIVAWVYFKVRVMARAEHEDVQDTLGRPGGS